jgi:uncharacterized membrane protein
VSPAHLNAAVMLAFIVLALGVLALIFAAPTLPRFPQVAFLMLVAFCVSNKVYSPQYVLWLLPFAVLARPRWRDFLIWQGTQVLYAVSVWLFLETSAGNGPRKGFNEQTYGWFILVMIVGNLWFSALVVRDILKPEKDVVRQTENQEVTDNADCNVAMSSA